MNYAPIITQFVKSLWWLIPIMLLLGFLRSPWFKGAFGEALVKLMAWLCLPAKIYHPLHNVTLPTIDGTTQIDHVFVSCFGIFVVETKNMRGWIFGGERQRLWTQKIFKKTATFQNPLHQNYKHVKALEAALAVPPDIIHSIIVFVGDSTFKSPMPANVTHGGGYITYIKSFHEPVLSEVQVQQAIAQIQSGRYTATWETHRKHVHQLKKRSDPTAERICPRCGHPMVLRTVQRGTNVGKQFWGCSGYPKCRMIQNIN